MPRKRYETRNRGITLLITLLLMGVLLGVSASLLNITLKQYQLAGIALSSETAFQAATAGLECILYHDLPPSTGGESLFYVRDDGVGIDPAAGVPCMDETSNDLAGGNNSNAGDELGRVESGEEQRFEFSWGSACSEVSIYKFSDATNPLDVVVDGKNMRDFDGDGAVDPVEQCPPGSVCTVVQARGYNVPCSEIDMSPRVVEREYTQIY